MRLLQSNKDGTGFSLVEFVGVKIPPYTILSHTWGPDRDEVTFRDLAEGSGKDKLGYTKLELCAKWSARDNIDFFWIDTCCIDKSSSAELSEAINSMFRWYRNSAKCYVYLPDVSDGGAFDKSNEFAKSRWFTRGWTLQELVAPKTVEFFCLTGKQLGDRVSLVEPIHRITGIPMTALEGRSLSDFGIEERFSWSHNRNTKREEDAAYSMLGLFDVIMPLLYGEGRDRALARLRREVDNSPSNQATVTTTDSITHQKNARLRRAAETGNISVAKRMLEGGADIHNYDNQLRTPLHMACLTGTSKMVEFLLYHGAQPDEMDELLSQPLHAAASRGDVEIAQILLKNSTDPDIVDAGGNTPLHLAAKFGHEAMVEFLLSVGADNSRINKNSETAVRIARRNGNLAAVRKLQKHHTREIAKVKGDDPELKMAAEQGNLAMVEAWLDWRIPETNEALFSAVEHGHSKIVKVLAEVSRNIDAACDWKGNALCVAACQYSGTDTVKVLLEKGANVNWQGGFYGNALQSATANYRLETVKLLLDYGADVNAQGGHYGNALTAAARHHTNFTEMAELFLAKGVDVNAQGPGEYGNPLQTAVYIGHEQNVKFLMDHGASKWVSGRFGSALDIAQTGAFRFQNSHEQRKILLILESLEVVVAEEPDAKKVNQAEPLVEQSALSRILSNLWR